MRSNGKHRQLEENRQRPEPVAGRSERAEVTSAEHAFEE
jgi:hypothetical protein